jgi:hypothetical protein
VGLTAVIAGLDHESKVWRFAFGAMTPAAGTARTEVHVKKGWHQLGKVHVTIELRFVRSDL